jgi:hypothetical protein
MFSTLKLWGAAAGAAVIAGIVVALKVLKGQRDRARRARDTLRATIGAKKRAEMSGRRSAELLRKEEKKIEEEVEKPDEDFKGIDNLSDSNDY